MKMSDWAKRINYLGDSVGGDNNIIDLNPDKLIEIAKKSTGLENFGDSKWLPHYYYKLDQYKKMESRSLIKLLLLKSHTLISLRNRLFITEEISRNPNIIKESIGHPLIITGLPRSGTSILFELLSEGKEYRSPLGFEAAFPVKIKASRKGKVIGRRDLGQCLYDIYMDINPEIRIMHENRGDFPAECGHIISLAMGHPFSFFEINTCQDMTLKIDANYNYKWHKIVLQILQHGATQKNWLLKCPSHLYYLKELFSSYPEAKIIHTHRDPARVIPSLLSLLRAFGVYPDAADKEASEKILSFIAGGLRKSIKQRQSNLIPSHQITDIHFYDFMQDPWREIKKVLKKLGIKRSNYHEKKYWTILIKNLKESTENINIPPKIFFCQIKKFVNNFVFT